jgi:hypothetical protein
MHAEGAHRVGPECPRCGYGLVASIPRVRAEGDQTVTCPECGLECRADDLEADAAYPRWSIESPAQRGAARRFVGTFLHALRPLPFWRAMRMDMPLSPRGVLRFLMGIALLAHITVVAATMPSALHQRMQQGVPARLLVPDIFLGAVFPCCPAYGGDILLAAAHGDPDRGIGVGTLARFARGVIQLTVGRGQTSFPSVARSASPSGIYAADAPVSYDALPSRFVADSNLLNLRRAWAIVAAIASIPAVTSTLLLLLPVTLRRARIRRAHIIRAAAYATAAVPCATAYLACLLPLLTIQPQWADRYEVLKSGVLAIPFGSLCFSAIWMHGFARQYLRLQRIWLINALLHIIVVLAALLTVFTIANL